MASSESPDLILMDIGLPGMDGFEALDVLKNSEKTNDIPVIAISASAMEQEIERGKNAGFFAYLTRPFDVPVILNTVRSALEEHGSANLS